MQAAGIAIGGYIELVVLVRAFEQECGPGIVFFFSYGDGIEPAFGSDELKGRLCETVQRNFYLIVDYRCMDDLVGRRTT